MKKLLFILFFFICYNSFSQSPGNDTSRYIHSPKQYGIWHNRMKADSVSDIPSDTLFSKDGIARIGTRLFVGNGFYWTGTGANVDLSTDSVTLHWPILCVWEEGFSQCVNLNLHDTIVAKHPLNVILKQVSGALYDTLRIKGSNTPGQVLTVGVDSNHVAWEDPTGGTGGGKIDTVYVTPDSLYVIIEWSNGTIDSIQWIGDGTGVGGGGSSYTFGKSVFESGGAVSFLNDSTTLSGTQAYGYASGVRGWQPALGVSLAGLGNGNILEYHTSDSLWHNVAPAVLGTAWTITGNSGTTAGTNFLGTTDNVSLTFGRGGRFAGILDSSTMFKTFYGMGTGNGLTSTGIKNSAFGYKALNVNTTGAEITAGGYLALKANTTGVGNTAWGSEALTANVSGSYNTATGWQALFSNTGTGNTADGIHALYYNSSGTYNTGVGYQALYGNATGTANTAVGRNAMHTIANQSYNTSVGESSMFSNTGNNNSAIGYEALTGNTSGAGNTASGYQAIRGNSTGNYNVGIGNTAMYSSTTGTGNTALGTNALYHQSTGSFNVAVGYAAGMLAPDGNTSITVANHSVFIGHNTHPLANSQENQNIIGDSTNGLGSNSTSIGNYKTVLAQISGRLSTGTGASIPAPTDAIIDARGIGGVLFPRVTTAQRDAFTYTSSIQTLVLTPGSGYTNGQYTVSFSGGGGSGAAATVVVAGGIYLNFVISNYGSGYTSAPTATISAGAGTGGAITVAMPNLEGLTIFCTDCTATDTSTGVLQTRSSGSWRNHY